MQPRLTSLPRPKINTELGEFDVEEWNGVNESGYEAENDRVMVLPDQASSRTAGGIELTEETVEKIGAAAVTGVIVAVGPDAFVWNGDRARRRESPPPPIGTRVLFARYSGELLHGVDRKIYRVMDDKCIGAVEKPAAMPIKTAKAAAS